MTLHFCARFHHSGIKSVALCQTNQPDIWQELCKGLSINSGLVRGTVSLYYFHLSNKKAIKQYCDTCEDLWTSQLRSEVIPVLEKLFGCRVDDTIWSYVGLYPTYLRSINGRYFLLPYGVSRDRIREIIIHELSHFYCYAACGNYLTSDKLWQLSERVVPYVLKYHFGIDNQEACYAGESSISENALYCSWAKMEIPFYELMISLQHNA